MILAIFDRDGTIIKNDDFFGKKSSWRFDIEYNLPVIDLLKKIASLDSRIVVVTNQTGVARKFFTCNTVEEINYEIDDYLATSGIQIDGWEYCPDADKKYADKMKDIDFDENFVKEKTIRKPSTGMVEKYLKNNDLELKSFDKVFVVGNSDDDKLLAKNLKCPYIDVNNKDSSDLFSELDKIIN